MTGNDSKAIPASREAALQEIRDGLRPGQQQMADWEGGPLAVSAVPGAGKSTGMASAAAIAIARYHLNTHRQLVVVTFTRAAAANIRSKINEKLKNLGLPMGGFLVYTLHALALNIARQHPELSGLDLENSTLILPTPSNRLTRTCVELWINNYPRHYQRLIEGMQFDGEETERLRRQSVLRTEVLPDLSWKVIQEAKSSGLKPSDLRDLATIIPDEYEILAIAAGLYENYEKLLKERQLMDYDEMILAALRVLKNDRVRQQWQQRVFAVFEDEAQDSTPLQTELLKILATDSTSDNILNLVRVGDPNQAINSTFTPADPIYFRDFCKDCKNQDRLATMDQAGRSSQIIIDAANFVLKWVNNSQLAGSEKPFREQEIHPVSEGDPQYPNPAATGLGLELYRPVDVYQTVELIAERVIQLIQDNPEGKFAILVRENKQGEFISNLLTRPDEFNFKVDLREYPIKIYDASLAARNSRIPAEILSLLQFIDRPHSPDYLKAALKVFSDRQLIPNQDFNALVIQPEEFLYPSPLESSPSDQVRKCRLFCRGLLQARLELAPFQLISFLALTLQYERSELATADKLAERIVKQTAGNNSIPAIVNVLNEIVSSERFETVDIDENKQNESVYTRKGQLTIITMHKAKGLDWDYVFLPFLHEQTIPGGLRVLPQSRFLGEFTLSEVARAQIRAYLHQQNPLPNVTQAWEQAGYLKTAEEYRLLYVAMTRAKQLLWMSAARQAPFSWHKPENLQAQKPCPILPALKERFPDYFKSC
ncbi:uvrD/REP helicase N-terminal domain protein [Lyngbya aestuarii BL J]|uniref:DNA 3'-5' helicase n=1 Tax=Lyngbya aestuarii BL J TaxID=1348334 RepID=U7QG08_9CYAN|nr:uvrD/REP helicase N-terminal domain protein [Lyngbya aestuarii BL J]